jgi:hypothetical protein
VLTVVIVRMVWAWAGYSMTLMWLSVPNPFSTAEQVFDLACSRFLRHAEVQVLAGKRRASRLLTLALSPDDLNKLLVKSPLHELESIATAKYRNQLSVAGLLDPQRSPIVSLVSMPGLGHGRYQVWAPDELTLAGGPASSTGPDVTASFDADVTEEFLQQQLRPHLRVCVDGGVPFIPGNAPFKIGRDKQCDVVVDAQTVSRVHLLVEPSKGGWVVIGNASKHGLWVNAVQVDRFVLTSGETALRLGSWSNAPTVTVRMTSPTAVAS